MHISGPLKWHCAGLCIMVGLYGLLGSPAVYGQALAPVSDTLSVRSRPQTTPQRTPKRKYSWAALVRKPFERFQPPGIPDYSQLPSWSVHPALPRSPLAQPRQAPAAAPLPEGLPEVDVFYVYPTLFRSSRQWNADLSSRKLNRQIDRFPVRYQASVFAPYARVFAPRYRQAALFSFIDTSVNGKKALDLALGDVVMAFDHYLAHYNQGRPFILAGHSQGAYHLLRYLRDYLAGSPARGRMVAAYLIGLPSHAGWTDAFPFCESPEQTGCWLTYSTFARQVDTGHSSLRIFTQAKSLNPVSFRCDTLPAGADAHLGYANLLYRYRPAPADLMVQARDGIVRFGTRKFRNPGLTGGDNYHVLDFNLFYGNLQANVRQRIQAWAKKSW